MGEKLPITPLTPPARFQIRSRLFSYVLTLLLLLGAILIWRIDTSNVRTFIRLWRYNQDFETPDPNSTKAVTTRLKWISAPPDPNFTANLLRRMYEPCVGYRTVEVSIPRMDGRDSIELTTGEIHEFAFHTLDENGNPSCSKGDYFETDVSGSRWKSRPPLKDLGNGSYSFSLQIHPDFHGDYNFTLILLFRNFEGLKFSTQRFAFDRTLRSIPIRFSRSKFELPDLRICSRSDFGEDTWYGRWTKEEDDGECEISDDGRYRCLRSDTRCRKPWCEGVVASLESNGWVYSAHCAFEIISTDSAWNCMNNRWIFFWGDSNHVDTIRNTLNFILGLSVPSVPRRFDLNFTNPRNSNQSVRITSIFNGHANETMNYQGLQALRDEGFRGLLEGYFSGDRVPDLMVMNSGLHDGIYWRNMKKFIAGAEYAAAFWAAVMDGLRRRGVAPPEILYRTTVATGGYARSLGFNPSKMEVFNAIVVEKMRARGLIHGVVDDFDMTYAWHFDNRCNDGVHYGRPPAKMRWRDGKIGHHYFVDLMLAHVLLNRMCVR